MKGIRERIGWEDSEEDEITKEDCEERPVEKTHSLPFTRKRQVFTFVRGSVAEIVWDDWDHPSPYKSKGNEEGERNGIPVEIFYQIQPDGELGKYHGWNGEMTITPERKQEAEVVTGNVTHRTTNRERDMILLAHATHTEYIHPETGEVHSTSSFPDSIEDIKYEIKEDV